MGQTNIKKIILLVAIIVIIACIGTWYFHKNQAPKNLHHKVMQIDTRNQPSIGNPNAKVHVVAFEDLKCGNCMRYSTLIFPTIKKKYIDTGVAKYTLINLAFIPGSLPAANAAHCLYTQNKTLFFPFVEYIYNHQPAENQNWATIPTLLEFASKIKGANIDELKVCMISGAYDTFIKNNLKIAGKIMDPVATPSVFVNGVKVEPLTIENLSTMIKHAR